MRIKLKDLSLELNEKTLALSIIYKNTVWNTKEFKVPYLQIEEDKKLYFTEAINIKHTEFSFGLGIGIKSEYEDFCIDGKLIKYKFATQMWIEASTGHLFMEFIPLNESGLRVKKVFWPREFEFRKDSKEWYTLLNIQQGLLIPNNYANELGKIPFDGFFGTAGGYMPWFAQVKDKNAYIAICTTPWNAAYQASHKENSTETNVSVRFEESFGKIEYRRILRYTFLENATYNEVCKVYRQYVKEQGRLKTLKEKIAKTAKVEELIGAAFVHMGIKTAVSEDSDFYDPANPTKNNRIVSFKQRQEEIENYHNLGVEKLYLHLDGYAEPGYDNEHPDYNEACKEAGGFSAMRELSNSLSKMGYLFGIHDQYRDYYKKAKSFDEHYACSQVDGSIFEHKRWAGGPQAYLCTSFAPYYVKRNFEKLREENIHLDCAYLDVFTCNEGDECNNPYHKMSRRESYEFRNICFEYLLSRDILPSSEEVSDWAVPSLVFCHYAPYEFMMKAPGSKREGIAVPLYNLVYHDCMIIPWMMDKISDKEDYMLYALLNAGLPYLRRDGAYPNTDGSFDNTEKLSIKEEIARCKVVTDLHKHLATEEMLAHEFVDGDYGLQMTTFANGTKIIINLKDQTYYCLKVEGKNE